MSEQNPIKRLYHRLSEVGLTRSYLQTTALPTWWDDSIADNPSGYAQCLLLLSRHLGLELTSLQADNGPVRLRDFGICKFKKRADATVHDLALSRALATRAAHLAAAAVANSSVPLPVSASDIRDEILDEGARWVGLEELIEYCWKMGIPVLHLDHFPKGAKRPDGFAARVDGRPVIVLCRHLKSSAWLLFTLAHELGHLAMGHVPEEGTLLDQKIDPDSVDGEEKQANEFALELLTGSPNRRVVAVGRWPNAASLAHCARVESVRSKMDPGHLVLNYAHSMGKDFFPVANAALKLLSPDDDAVSAVRCKMAENLDWSLLPEDSSEFLMRVTQYGQLR